MKVHLLAFMVMLPGERGCHPLDTSGSQSMSFCFFPRQTHDSSIMALAQEYHVEHESLPVNSPRRSVPCTSCASFYSSMIVA